jgi:hypothetical protein
MLATSDPEVEGNHGRIETRQAFLCTDVAWRPCQLDGHWPERPG